LRVYPALDVAGADLEIALGLASDFEPAAAEELNDRLTLFFLTVSSRDAARDALAAWLPHASLVCHSVDDGDWARRSQENLQPVSVGRITLHPRANPGDASAPPAQSAASPIDIVIIPSMGFGTGHHETTRLCLTALQSLDLAGARVLDVGTGSGVLAIAARLLGAATVVAIDNDPDAIEAARESLAWNPIAAGIDIRLAAIGSLELSVSDVATANLTGALLEREAASLRGAVRENGQLILSGLRTEERDAVLAAFEPCRVTWESEENGWAAMMLVPVSISGSSAIMDPHP